MFGLPWFGGGLPGLPGLGRGLEDKAKGFLFGNRRTTSTQALPAPTPMQAFAENQLYNTLQGYNPYLQQQGLAKQAGGMMQRLMGYGLAGTPEQNALLEAQTANYIEGLKRTLEQHRQTAMSQAKQEALRRGIPLSDIARGQEANVEAGINRALAQGYTQAKMQELQNKLNLPMQYLPMMANLQQQFASPLQQMAYNVGMSRYQGPRDVTQVGPTPGFLDVLGQMAGLGKMVFGGGGSGGVPQVPLTF